MLLTLLSLLPLAGTTPAAQEDRPPAPEAAREAAQEPATPAEGEAAPKTPVVVTPEELERRIASLYEGTLIGAKDGEDFAETPAYRRLLEIVGSYAEGELA